MPILLILALLWVASLSSCVQNANAFTINNTNPPNNRIDLNDQIKQAICNELPCFEHISIEQFKMQGTQLAAIKGEVKWKF